MKNLLCLTAAIVLLSLPGCSWKRISDIPSYKLKVIQGNELDQQALSNLRMGMSREQVQMLLGTPLLQDPFHSSRWDYVFVVSRNGVVKKNKSLTLYFDENGNLARVEGDALPVAPAPVAAPAPSAPVAETPQPAAKTAGKTAPKHHVKRHVKHR